MEIEVVAHAEHLALDSSDSLPTIKEHRYVSTRAFFKFVSLNEKHATINVK